MVKQKRAYTMAFQQAFPNHRSPIQQAVLLP